MDTSYFIKAFSATPAAVVPGYTIGGIAYFAIPWGLGTVMSSVAIGLENSPAFPTFPRVSTPYTYQYISILQMLLTPQIRE